MTTEKTTHLRTHADDNQSEQYQHKKGTPLWRLLLLSKLGKYRKVNDNQLIVFKVYKNEDSLPKTSAKVIVR
jgi:hypothetical protein